MRPTDRQRSDGTGRAARERGAAAAAPRRRARAAAVLGAAVIAALLAGCAAGPRPRAGYDARVDSLGPSDPGRLAGRRIVLDPGHGGFFPGALGVRGLTEAEVNLGVALELAGLLRARGAEVRLTRETDRDFLTPADSSLRSDLAERVRIANDFRPDLFVSIHHNADAGARHDVNEIQVYYPIGDEGPALEAAADVHRFLTRNLGIAPSRLIPGNFAVLRGSEAPALLTESSYITYPPTEAKLRRDEARRLEAEALFLGIAAYFSRHSPAIEEFRAWWPELPGADSAFTTGYPALRARVRGAFDAVALAVDGVRVTPRRDGDRLDWRPETPLAAGPHEATLSVRLAGEGSSRRERVRFTIAAAPAAIEASFPGQVMWDGDQPLGLRVRVLDPEGLALRDGHRLRVRDDRTGLLAPADTVVELRDGCAWAYFRRAPGTPRERAPVVRLAVRLEPEQLGEFVPLVEEVRAALAFQPGLAPPVRTAFAKLGPGDEPLREAPGTREPDPAVRWINRDGFVRLESDSIGLDVRPAGRPNPVRVPELAGYRSRAGEAWPPRFAAIAGGALHGRRIVLDPAGGGDDAAGAGPSGARGAALNLETARMLAAMLAAAGAEVRLTRDADAAVSDLERVRLSEAFRAERYVRIGHPAAPPRVGHYFSSGAGRRWAARLAGIAETLGLPRPAVGDDAQYPITQTSATALSAALGRVDEGGDPLGGMDPARLRTEAYALYLSLAREWAPEAEWPMDSLEVRDPAGRPLARAPVRFGGALVLQTDPLGRIRFARTEPGPMLVEVEDSVAPSARVLLDSERGIVLTGPGPP